MTNLQVEWRDMELSGATVRLKVLPKHFPEHGQNLCGTGEVHRLSSVFYSKFTNSRERLLKRVNNNTKKMEGGH